MRKAINGIFFVMVLALLFAGCNNPAGPEEETGEAEDITLTFDYTLALTTGDTYIGGTIDIQSNDNGKKLLDISKYATVIVDAELLDENGEMLTIDQANGLAQFALLENNSDWSAKIGGTSAYNMKINGTSEMNISATATGIPAYLLIEAPKDGQQVFFVKVKTITFVAKVSDVSLSVVFVKTGHTYVSASGNRLTFDDAMYSDGAALYEFPEDVLPLTDKIVTFAFRLENYDASLEHQLHIQAASGTEQFNGRNTQPGQKYITVDDDVMWSYKDGAGVFTVDGNALIAASEVEGNQNDLNGPFELTAVRIVNNGSTYTEGAVTHYREKSYTIIFDSITVAPKIE